LDYKVPVKAKKKTGLRTENRKTKVSLLPPELNEQKVFYSISIFLQCVRGAKVILVSISGPGNQRHSAQGPAFRSEEITFGNS
jgi:hypothetical protein